MLKSRIIPVLTFNGFALVKTRKFSNPRMVGNPVQAARVYNNRGVDELIFLDIFATRQKRKINLKIVKEVIKECFMPVGIGGGIESLEDINNLLKIGADKVIIKNKALLSPTFIKESSNFFGSQCISISLDVTKHHGSFVIHNDLNMHLPLIDFIKKMEDSGAGEFILNSVDNDGEMNGFDIDLVIQSEGVSSLPIVCVGGAGNLDHYAELFTKTNCDSVGSASIFHFTQYTPLDIKLKLASIGRPVRI
jgi:cyclase|tara:strand:- start:5563 stop:6309 length:747 start_codon:yes stop_codon:yes gene_type:complete